MSEAEKLAALVRQVDKALSKGELWAEPIEREMEPFIQARLNLRRLMEEWPTRTEMIASALPD